MYLACDACALQYDVSQYNEGTRIRCKCGEVLTVPAQRVTRISCASCGAQVAHDATQCPYCRGAVRRGVCPACFQPLRRGAKFCDECGGSIRPQVVKTPEATDRECPRCDGKLFHVHLEGHAFDQCSSCGGLWVDSRTVESIMRDRPQAIETGVKPDLATGNAENVGLLTGEFKGRVYVPCPQCKKIMTPQNYARSSGVIVDVCREHGIWFDAGELNKILDFISRGGLVEARKKEALRAKEEAASARADAKRSKQTSHSVGVYGGSAAGMTTGAGDVVLVEALVEGVGALWKMFGD